MLSYLQIYRISLCQIADRLVSLGLTAKVEAGLALNQKKIGYNLDKQDVL
jgi:hypothetical protein